MFLAKQDIKNVPFQVLYEKVTLAIRAAEANLTKVEENAYERMISRKEEEYSSTHEAPYEGNFRELYPYNPPDPGVVSEEKAKAKAEALVEQIDKLGLKAKASWLLPQLTAYIAKMHYPRTAQGKIDSLGFLQSNFIDDWHKGLYFYCMCAQRGALVPQQYTVPFRNYSALVPLLMMPAKKFNGIKYSDWDNIKSVVDLQLYRAMSCDIPRSSFSFEEIMQNREHGLLYKSGTKEGEARNPATSYKLYGSATDNFAMLPWLAQVMLAQIWCAHPTNRTDVMVLDWENWDSVPDQLIVTEVIPESKKVKTTYDTPWYE